ncbi:MAG: ribonuclease E/G [Pseudomonadota bacterium]
MSTDILLDESPFGTRALAVRDDRACGLAYDFAQRTTPQLGELLYAKALHRDDRLGGQICDIGAAGEGLLPIRDRARSQGDGFIAAIRREGQGTKRPTLSDRPALRLPAATLFLDDLTTVKPGPMGQMDPPKNFDRPGDQQNLTPGPLKTVPGPLRLLTLLSNQETQAIHVSSGLLAAKIKSFVPDTVEIIVNENIAQGIREGEEEALSRTVPLEEGGHLIIDSTEALTAIDLDLGRMGSRSQKGAADKLKRRALEVLADSLTLRSIGGQIVFDFPRGAVKAPKMLRDQMTALLKPGGLTNIPAVTKEGLVIGIATQPRRPVLDDLTERTPSDDPRPAHRLRADVLAWHAYDAVKHALRSAPSQTLTLALGHDLEHPWQKAYATKALNTTYGPRLALEKLAEDPRGFQIR